MRSLGLRSGSGGGVFATFRGQMPENDDSTKFGNKAKIRRNRELKSLFVRNSLANDRSLALYARSSSVAHGDRCARLLCHLVTMGDS